MWAKMFHTDVNINVVYYFSYDETLPKLGCIKKMAR